MEEGEIHLQLHIPRILHPLRVGLVITYDH